ncbi:endonuclease/exonuclease/phosphatase family protein [Streptomyces aidingensis]|uniref:Endonuclease/Exonuclease/phosphatase family protein n=1 Tax=Streptomyces aidingensis TaxID=910347 RepID=A0A1I1RJ20_9ACTN|nr:endonuclease/exonuclease/phosphatase family protein [Streptomyces aidingensis]SFD31643.1 Endonuclease/Exonuclease/phosphatase family protein [Streptomyces aidingensis]
MKRRASRLVAAAAFAWLGYVLLHTALSGRWWPMLLADLAPPLLLALAPLVLAAPAVPAALAGPGPRRRPRRWLPVVACAVAFALGAGQSGLDLGGWGRGPGRVPPDAVHIVAWNALYWHQDDDPDAFYAYLRSFDADVYLIQEYLNWRADSDTPLPVDDTARLRREFPGYRIITAGELLTLSRLPVAGSRALTDPPGYDSAPPGTDFPAFWRAKTLRTDVRTGGGIIALYNTHIPVQLDTSDGVFTPAFLKGVRRQSLRRTAAWTSLTGDLLCTAVPRLVAGDLNTTPAMGELDRLDDLLVRARPTDGGVYPVSWDARRLPLWQLDFTFHDPGVRLHRYRFRDSPGLSDHSAQEFWITTEGNPRT